MNISKINEEGYIKLALYSAASAFSIYKYYNFNIENFLLFILLLILNNRIRITILKNKYKNVFIFSLLFDILIIYLINMKFPFVSYILVFITIMDSIIYLKYEGYIISAIALIFLIYIIYFRNMDIVIFNILLFIIIDVFSITLRNLREKLKKSEIVYDENRKYSYQLEDSKKMLKEYAKRIENISQLEERNRISREIHDSVGHKLTGVLMQLDAAIRVYNKDPEKSIEISKLVRDNLSSCIELMRSTVRNIAPSNYYNISIQVQNMINDFKAQTGVSVSFKINGSARKLNAAYEAAIYKNIEEALTNAVKHGGANEINVELNYNTKMVSVIISDNGCGCNNIVKGMGISGMEERANLIGGKLKFSSINGFKVVFEVPINE